MSPADREPPIPSGSEKPKVFIDAKTGREVRSAVLTGSEKNFDLATSKIDEWFIEVLESEITDENRDQIKQDLDGKFFKLISQSAIEVIEKKEDGPRPRITLEEEEKEKTLETIKKAFELAAPEMTPDEYRELADFYALEENYEKATEFAQKAEAFIAKAEAASSDEEKLAVYHDFGKEVRVPMINYMRGIETPEDEEGEETDPEREKKLAALEAAIKRIAPELTPDQYEEVFQYLRNEENRDAVDKLVADLEAPMQELQKAIDAKDEGKEQEIRAGIREKILIPFINSIVEIDSPEKQRAEAEARRRLEQKISALEIQKQEMIREHDATYARLLGKQINPREFHPLSLDGERVMAQKAMAIARVHLEQAKYRKEYREKYGEDWPKPPEFIQHLLEKSQGLPEGTFSPDKPGMIAFLNVQSREKQLEMLAVLKKKYEEKKEIEKRKKNLKDKGAAKDDKTEGGADKTFTRELLGAQEDVLSVLRDMMGARLRMGATSITRGPLLRMFNRKDKGGPGRFAEAISALEKAHKTQGSKFTNTMFVNLILTAALETAKLSKGLNVPEKVIGDISADAMREIGKTKDDPQLIRELPRALKRLRDGQKKNKGVYRVLDALRVQAEILRSHF